MKSVVMPLPSGTQASQQRRVDALRIAAHVSALDRWIAMLMAQGVNRKDDELVALARRRQTLLQQRDNKRSD